MSDNMISLLICMASLVLGLVLTSALTMSDTPDLDRAREAANDYLLAAERDQEIPFATWLREGIATLILEQRAEEAERSRMYALANSEIYTAFEKRAADLRRQAGAQEPTK